MNILDNDRYLADIRKALDTVYDPELDQSISELDFVKGISINQGRVCVTLGLPTYWCSPNFAFIMMEDIDQALSSLPWVKQVRVILDDHESSTRLNAGIAEHKTFPEIFSESPGDLEKLRRTFAEKAFYARQKYIVDLLTRDGLNVADWIPGNWKDLKRHLTTSREGQQLWDRYYLLAQKLGIASGDHDPAITGTSGKAVTGEMWERHFHQLRLITLNMESNAHICRGLLRVRYQPEGRSPLVSLPLVDQS